MKKRRVSVMAVVALMLTATTAFASSGGIVMFGDNVQRTHENGFTDKYPWSKEVYLGSGAAGGISMASSSTAIGAGNIMFYPVSAGTPSNNFQGTGYMTTWDMSKWSWDSGTSQNEPTMLKKVKIPDVSNSSPAYAGGYAYLAAGGTFYKFDSTGNIVNTADISTGGTWEKLVGGSLVATPSTLSTSPIDANQVVSYPLYATASELGTSTDEVWVSSQNGYLFGIDPNTMSIVQKVYLGQRLDASPSAVAATNGSTYIAVTAAASPGNKSITLNGTTYSSGSGFLLLVNPRNGAVTVTIPNPYNGSTPSVASPVSLDPNINGGPPVIPGGIMWNDVNGDVFLGTVNPDGTVTYDHQWDNTGNGQTSDFSESGFSSTYDQYIVPFTDGGTYGYATVNPKTYDVKQVAVAGNSGPIKAFGSPEISAYGNLYLADTVGGVDQIAASSSGGFGVPSSSSTYLASQGSSAGTTLSTPSELMLDTKGGSQAPTLTLATNQGLELWVDGGEDLTFETQAGTGSYASSSATQFSQPLRMGVGAGNLPVDPGNSDLIAFDLTVNGGAQMDDIGSVATYDAAGNPLTGSIPLSQTDLNNWLSQYNTVHPGTWNASGQNNAVITAYIPSTDAETYVFQGTTATPNGSSAQVYVTFPAPNAVPATPPSNPAVGCVTVNNVSCSSALPGYTEWRFLSPGMLNTNEGQGFTGLGTAYKLHPIPEQAINSSPAAQYTTYYTYQDNPDGHTNPSNDVQPANWLNNFTIEFVGASGMAVNFDVQGKIATTGDMEFEKTYIGAWQPHWKWISYPLGGGYWKWKPYTPIYNHEYLYRNVGINETTNNDTLVVQKNATVWWNPSTINVTASGTFSSEDTPITPAGSAMTWTQPVWASYGGWVPTGSTAGTDFSQVPVTPGLNNTNSEGLTPNSMLPGTKSDDKPANAPAPDTLSGTWYSDSIMPAPNTPGDFSPQGIPVSHAFDSEHNGGVIFEPNAAHSDYPSLNAGTWWVMPVFDITSGSSSFEHSQISTWVPTWSKPWYNNSGQGVVSTETSTVKWNS